MYSKTCLERPHCLERPYCPSTKNSFCHWCTCIYLTCLELLDLSRKTRCFKNHVFLTSKVVVSDMFHGVTETCKFPTFYQPRALLAWGKMWQKGTIYGSLSNCLDPNGISQLAFWPAFVHFALQLCITILTTYVACHNIFIRIVAHWAWARHEVSA